MANVYKVTLNYIPQTLKQGLYHAPSLVRNAGIQLHIKKSHIIHNAHQPPDPSIPPNNKPIPSVRGTN